MSRPGCYGSFIAISHLSETCRSCLHSESCGRQAALALETMEVSPAVLNERKRLAAVTQGLRVSGKSNVAMVTQAELERVAALPAAVSTMVKKKLKGGWFEFARQELRAGRNPGSKPWEKLLCAALLDGGISQRDLTLAFQTQLGMTPGSAKVRACKALAVFREGLLARERGGLVVLEQGIRDTTIKIYT